MSRAFVCFLCTVNFLYQIKTSAAYSPALLSSQQMKSEDPQQHIAVDTQCQAQSQPQVQYQAQPQVQYIQSQGQPQQYVQVQYMQPHPQLFQGQYGQQPVQPQFGQAQPQVQYMQLQGGPPQMFVQPQQLAQPTFKPEGPQDCCMCSAPPELQQWLRIASGVTLFFAIPQVICAAVTYDYVTTPKLGAWWLIIPSVITCILGLLSIARYIFHLTEFILNRSSL
jgi:hypothetical protein